MFLGVTTALHDAPRGERAAPNEQLPAPGVPTIPLRPPSVVPWLEPK